MTIELKADASAAGRLLKHFWSVCTGAGRANEGLRADWQEHLRLAVNECGFKYVRFHGLYHDDMFVYQEQNGRAIYNFQYVEILFDKLLEIGVKPFVEFGFCPGDLATEKGTVFWWKGNGSPPKDYAKWAELIRRTVAHWIERYGLAEVRSWYFEVWNEPNLHPFFRGSKSQYFELYKVTAKALKEIDSQLRIGGPATSNFVPDARFDGETEDTSHHKVVTGAKDINALDWQPVWMKQFLAFCQREKLPMDFVSCHPYPTDWALDEHAPDGFRKNTREVGATPRDLKLIRKIVNESPYPMAEIHLTEWSSSSSPRDFTHDFLQAATYVTKANLESIGAVDSLSYWTFTDVFEEGGCGDTIFHGGFGMINLQGIVKPTFHAYRFMNALGDELLGKGTSGVVTRCSKTKRLSAIAWHYPPEMPQSVPASFDSRDKAYETLALGEPEQLNIELTGLKPGAKILVETLDKQNGNAMGAWEAMGKPENPTREQTRQLREKAAATKQERFAADANGSFKLQRAIEPWSVVLIVETDGGKRMGANE
jgi:xylan 1,4-beta-xylosidase